jgi:Domain of unknown function (DUF4082)/Bacterial Ig-like domain/Bacterial Ig domain
MTSPSTDTGRTGGNAGQARRHPLMDTRTGVVRTLRRKSTAGLAVTTLVAGVLVVTSGIPASAATGCGGAANPIVCENALAGTNPGVWDIDDAGASDIQGYSTDISVNVGSTIGFKIDTNARAYTIQIFRTGYYQGLGARKIADVAPSASLPQTQPTCVSDPVTELYDCGNWALSASWAVPSDAVSGVYIALLKRNDNGDRSHITFIVRKDGDTAPVLFQTSDPTWQAYNTYGGSDFYQGAENGRAYKVSYNRPITTRAGPGGRDFYFSNEYPMVRFLEKNGYNTAYIAGVDTDRRGAELLNHKVFLSVGHDEYWSGAQRANVEAARDAGVNLQFLSGNELYWRTRLEPSVAGPTTLNRTLVSYKETWANSKIDPSPQWTGTWRDPRFASQANGGGMPENGLTGTMFMSNYTDLAVTVSSAEGKTRLWRNTSLANLPAGASAALTPHTIGYESDEDLDNGFRPAGLIRLSTTTGPTPQYVTDFGNTVLPGTTTHHITLYRAPSGALVFGAGTVQWSWGLDATHDGVTPAADVRMQQAQVNLLADMSALPSTLATGLVMPAESTDTIAPSATITSPAAGVSVANGTKATVTGTATDSGGIVAGVEVSTDGATWHPATGTTSWTYSYVQTGIGAQTIRVRAIDDSANYPSAPASRSITVTGPYSVFGATVPPKPDSGDGGAVELGLRFTPTQDGFISGVRFYKSAANTGTHTGSLWDPAGVRLANVTFTGETASGWQSASFALGVAVTAGTTYTVSYSAPNGHYSATSYQWGYFGQSSPPLTVDGGLGAVPAGVYGGLGGFPVDSYAGGNYFVDALFTTIDASPLTAGNQSPLPGSSSVPLATPISAVFSKAVQPSTISMTVTDQLGAAVPGSTTYTSSSRTVVFTPTSSLSGFVRYTIALTAEDIVGGSLSAGGSWSFTTVQPPAMAGVCPCGVFTDETVPVVLEAYDRSALSVGMHFTSADPGTITGMRFYKSPNNTGTHVGTLWTGTGTQLATVTFTNESTSGWQSAAFSTPVTLTPGSDYVVSYRSTTGIYPASPGVFSGGGVTRGSLTAGNGAGAYTYGAGFPSSTSSSSYLVDVTTEITKAPDPISVVSMSPSNGAIGVAVTSPVSITLSGAIASGYSLTATASGAALAGSASLSADGATITLTPSPPLPPATTIQVKLSNATSTQGSSLPTQTWSFTTASAAATTLYSLLGDSTPTVTSANDSLAVEVGMAFTASQAGAVTAIRFYKGSGNTGTHVGSLWSSTGTRLGTVTFQDETALGWQAATLATPITLSAGQTYIVSYLAPQGHYSYTSADFTTAKTSGPLTSATTDNGRYLYGAAGGFPTNSWNATNYFVDVTFAASPPAEPNTLAVYGLTPAISSAPLSTIDPS